MMIGRFVVCRLDEHNWGVSDESETDWEYYGTLAGAAIRAMHRVTEDKHTRRTEAKTVDTLRDDLRIATLMVVDAANKCELAMMGGRQRLLIG
jgi:hypothetical protein